MITNSTSNNAFSYWWVGTVQPTRSMRTTTSFWYTGCWHFVASFASEAIPGWQRMQVSLVTSQVLLICICHATVETVKNVIVAAWIWCWEGKVEIYIHFMENSTRLLLQLIYVILKKKSTKMNKLSSFKLMNEKEANEIHWYFLIWGHLTFSGNDKPAWKALVSPTNWRHFPTSSFNPE